MIRLDQVHVRHRIRGTGFFRHAAVHALTDASLEVRRGEILGLVGESGCGKSTLARVLTGLQRPAEGSVSFRGEDLWNMPRARRRAEFGSSVGVVFQDPSTALNPRMPVGRILRDPLDVHRRGTEAERAARVEELLDLVGLPPHTARSLPGRLSGGQRQRVAIARALALDPQLIVADEPTSALDVSVRAQVLNLLIELRERLDLGMVFISHDIQTVRYLADRLAVLYLGRVVEEGPADRVTAAPAHPYTEALLSATPSLLEETERIILTGPVPSATNPPSGCPFRTRCWKADEECATVFPVASHSTDEEHRWHCVHPENRAGAESVVVQKAAQRKTRPRRQASGSASATQRVGSEKPGRSTSSTELADSAEYADSAESTESSESATTASSANTETPETPDPSARSTQ